MASKKRIKLDKNNNISWKKNTFDEVGFYFKKNKDQNKLFVLKVFYLLIAIFLMGLAQGLLSYTHRIGMAPVDSITTSIAFLLGISYQTWNYFAVGLLVTAAIIFAAPKDKLLTSSAFITGYCLAFLVGFLINNVLVDFPGLYQDGTNNDYNDLGWAIFWFFIGYLSLCISIGLWINVGFGLRPYDIMIIRLSEKFPKRSYVFFRNILDASFVFASLIITPLSILVNPDKADFLQDFWSRNSISVGSIVFVFCTGFFTNFLKGIFAKPMNKLKTNIE